MTLRSRLGGHLVAGHIDGVGEVARVVPEDNALVVDLEAPEAVWSRERAAGLGGGRRREPHDRRRRRGRGCGSRSSRTPPRSRRCRGWRPASRVNLEADLIAKYVNAFVAGRKPADGLTWEKLAEAGF